MCKIAIYAYGIENGKLNYLKTIFEFSDCVRLQTALKENLEKVLVIILIRDEIIYPKITKTIIISNLFFKKC